MVQGRTDLILLVIVVFADEYMDEKLNNSCSMTWSKVIINLEALGLAFHNQGPTYISTYCQAVTKLVDCD